MEMRVEIYNLFSLPNEIFEPSDKFTTPQLFVDPCQELERWLPRSSLWKLEHGKEKEKEMVVGTKRPNPEVGCSFLVLSPWERERECPLSTFLERRHSFALRDKKELIGLDPGFQYVLVFSLLIGVRSIVVLNLFKVDWKLLFPETHSEALSSSYWSACQTTQKTLHVEKSPSMTWDKSPLVRVNHETWI